MKKSRILIRGRVEQALHEIFEYPLTILSATMGYGKTTSVRSYLENRNVSTIWVSLLGSDGEDYLFWHKLCISMERVFPEAGKALRNIGLPVDVGQLSEIMDYICTFHDEKQRVIVIDDYHLINESRPIGRLIEVIAEEEIPNLHIVLLTRIRPGFNYMNLLAKGLCCYLNMELLAFSRQEIKEYLLLMEYAATDTETELFYQYTNGWITAIYLLLLGLKQGVPITEISYLTKLIERNFFDTLEETTKKTLLKLSVLDSFTIPQAQQILEEPGIGVIIEQMMEQNAFIEYDRQTGVYKLHYVLLDFLRGKFTDEAEKRKVCYQAGIWFFEQENFIRAIEYCHQAGEIEYLLKQMNEKKYMRNGYFGVALLYKVFQEIPENWYIKYPIPLLHFVICFAIKRDRDMIRASNRILAVLKDYYENELDISTEKRNWILAEIEIADIFLIFNDAKRMVEYSRKAEQYLKGGVSCLIFRKDMFTFGVPHFLYSYYREAGKLSKTLACLQSGFPPRVFDGCGAGCELIAAAEYALETGDFDKVWLLAEQANYKAEAEEDISVYICVIFTKMRYYLVKGESEKAQEILITTRKYLTDSSTMVSSQSRVIYNAAIDMCEGYLFACLNEGALIPEWLQSGTMPNPVLMMRGVAFPWIIYGKAVMLSHNWTQLNVVCQRAKTEYQIFHNQLGLLHNAIYEAKAAYHLSGMQSALKILLPALQEAEMDGIILPFAEHAEYVLPMLYKIRRQGSMRHSYLEKVICLCEQYRSQRKDLRQTKNTLTEREIEVIAFLAQGMTQKEISETLFVSVSTTKKHLENIYRKLDVNNKISAVQKAKMNQII